MIFDFIDRHSIQNGEQFNLHSILPDLHFHFLWPMLQQNHFPNQHLQPIQLYNNPPENLFVFFVIVVFVCKEFSKLVLELQSCLLT